MVRVTLDDGSRLVLRRPAIRSDSIVERERSAAVPLAAVKGIEVRRTNGLRTAGAVIGGALILCAAICPRPEIPPICLNPGGCDEGDDQP
jgi:hypothetical protein